MPRVGRHSVTVLLAILLVDTMAFGLVLPGLPRLVERFSGGDPSEASLVYSLFVTGWQALQFIAAPVLGALSDRFGRRPVVLLSTVGLGLDFVVMALAPTIPWLLAGRLLSGATAALVPSAGAFIADVLPPARRTAAFARLGAVVGLAWIVGPALGGALDAVHPRLPFWVAAGCCLVNGLGAFLALPESLPPEHRSPFSWSLANPVGSLRLLVSTPWLRVLAVIGFLASLAELVFPSTFVLYVTHRFGWTSGAVGAFMAFAGVCALVVAVFGVARLVALLGDRISLVAGLVSGAIGVTLQGVATSGALFTLGVPVNSLWWLADSSAQTMMTRETRPEHQGQLQGAIAGASSIAGIAGPPLFARVFSWGLTQPGEIARGAPFLLSAAFLGLAALIALLGTRSPRLRRAEER